MSAALPFISARTNYAKMIKQNPNETGRTSTIVVPSSGGTFTSASRQKIEFLIPPISYLDTQASYLRFNAKMTLKTGAIAVPNTETIVATLDGGANSLFEAVQVFNSENQVVSEQRQHAEISLHRLRKKGVTYVKTIGKNAMGYSTLMEGLPEHPVYDGGSTNGSGLVGLVQNNRSEFPLSIVDTTGVSANISQDSPTVQFCIPLEYLSGLFAANSLIPLKYCGNRAFAFRLLLDMQAPNIAFVIAQALNNTLGSPVSPATDATVSYTLSNMELVTELVNVSQEADNFYAQEIMGTGVHLLYPDVSSKVDTQWTAGSQNYTALTPKYTISMNEVTVQIRNNTTISSYGDESITGTRRHGLRSIITKIGAMFYPNSPLLLDSAYYNGSAYLEVAKQSSGINNVAHQSEVGGFQAGFAADGRHANTSGFEIGFSYCKKDKGVGDEEDDFMFSGKDTRTGSSSLQKVLTRSDTSSDGTSIVGNSSVGLHITYIFGTTNVLVLEKGNSFPLERT